MDDILVYGKSVGEHSQHFETTLQKLQEANLILRHSSTLKKVEAILKMKTPQAQTELRTFVGMINQLSNFEPQIAELSKPLRGIKSSKIHWLWRDAQQQAFTTLKESLAFTPTLAHYDASRQTIFFFSDASSYGLKAVVMQLQNDGDWRPVAYESRAMSPTADQAIRLKKKQSFRYHLRK